MRRTRRCARVGSCIDARVASSRAEAAAAAPLPAPLPDDPAYVFFTSGTTGVPKAVVGVHKGLAHFVSWQRDTFGVGPSDRVAQVTGLSFDVVLREIFLPLVSGAALCLRPRNVVDDLAADPSAVDGERSNTPSHSAVVAQGAE